MEKFNIDELCEGNSIAELFEGISDGLDKKMVTVFPNTSYNFRMIGPILKVKRVFIESQKMNCLGVYQKEFRSIIENDKSTLELVIERLNKNGAKLNIDKKNPMASLADRGIRRNIAEFASNSTITSNDYIKAIEVLNKLFYKGENWQKCITSNIFIKSSPHGKNYIGTYCFTYGILNEIMKSTMSSLRTPVAISIGLNNLNGHNQHSKPIKLSGIDAHDLTISKNPNNANNANNANNQAQNLNNLDRMGELSLGELRRIGVRNNYSNQPNQHEVVIHPKTRLSIEEINYILRNGLYDIKKVIESINNKTIEKMSGYYYIVNDYKLPETLMDGFNKELSNIESDMHFEEVEDNICNIDQDAISDKEQCNGAIDSLEV